MRIVAVLSLLLVLASNTGLADQFQQATDAYDQKSYTVAFQLFEQLAKGNDKRAQFNVAYLYEKGQGTQQNFHQAIYWYKQAAKQKHINAMYNLGYLYQHGKKGIKNYKEALKWYTEAAKLGSASALVNIGEIYFLGSDEVKKDLTEAYAWFTLASARGSRNGLYNRDLVSGKLPPLSIASGETLYRQRKPVYVDPYLK